MTWILSRYLIDFINRARPRYAMIRPHDDGRDYLIEWWDPAERSMAWDTKLQRRIDRLLEKGW